MSSAATNALAGAVSAASNVAWFAPLLAAAIAYFKYDELDPEAKLADVDVEPLSMLPYYDFIIVGGGSAGK